MHTIIQRILWSVDEQMYYPVRKIVLGVSVFEGSSSPVHECVGVF